MPVHDGSGSNQDERLPPPGPEHSQGNPYRIQFCAKSFVLRMYDVLATHSSTGSNPSDSQAPRRVGATTMPDFLAYGWTTGWRLCRFYRFLVWFFCRFRAVNATCHTTSINHIVYTLGYLIDLARQRSNSNSPDYCSESELSPKAM